MNQSTRSAAQKAAIDIENAALELGCWEDDDTLTPGEKRQLNSLMRRSNDISILLGNMVDRADARRDHS